MKKLYVNPFLEVQEINVTDMLLISGVEFGGQDDNEIIEDWPW